jgi:glycosyltransferase involved in cell wall biosynthesis
MKVSQPEKVVFIPNWADELEVYPLSRSEAPFIETLGWKDKVVFQFFGNIGRVQGIENILCAIELVENKRAAFLFIGDGVLVKNVEDFIHKNPGKNVSYAGKLPLKDKNLGLAACDVALITLEAGMLGLGVPSKAYFSLAADKPLLAVMDDDAEISRVIRELGVGWHCRPNDPLALAKMIEAVCNINLELLAGKSVVAFRENYSEKLALDKFFSHVVRLVRPT